MCGIAGTYQQAEGKLITSVMLERLAHRGPDASAVMESINPRASVVLGHLRLSIIDLSAAADGPFTKNGLTITYNGELYNYRQLRAELQRSGVGFVTTSDTEVVLEAWRAWGPGCLERFRGMFAFAVHDIATDELAVARDPLGIKPLYVMRRGGGIVFASELKAIVTAVGQELSVDPLALAASALYYWLPEQVCAVQGVSKHPPGTWTVYRPDGTSESGTYWDPAEVSASAARGGPHDLREVVEESVEAHLVADVPVASFLSGGLDSSLVTAIAHRHHPGIEAYSIAFRGEDQLLEAMPDDARYARTMAQHLGIRLHEIEIAPDVVDMLPRVVDVLDEPIGDPAAINTLLMCESAREAGAKVLLSGMGADELFGGYRKHLACLLALRYQRVPGPVRRGVAGVVNRLPVAREVGDSAPSGGPNGSSPSPSSARRRPSAAATRCSLRTSWPTCWTRRGDSYVDRSSRNISDIYDDNDLDGPTARMCLADSRLFLPGLNLAYTDRSSMAASCEVRVPFVDPRVFEAAFALPESDRIRGRTQKAALRDVARHWLPDEIIDRPKASFGVPLRAWVNNDLSGLVDDVLLDGELVASGILQRQPLERLVADQRSGRRDFSKQVWQLLSLEVWYGQARAAGVRTV